MPFHSAVKQGNLVQFYQSANGPDFRFCTIQSDLCDSPADSFLLPLRKPFFLLFLTAFWAAGCSRQKPAPDAAAPLSDSTLHREWNPENVRLMADALPLLQAGDIVLRTGADATSHALRSMNQKNKLYSHCGIVAIEDGQLWVYHSIGGEDNPDARIQRETPERFYSPLSNAGGGACRYDLTPAQKAGVVARVQQWYREGRTFDMEFDLQTDEQLYCAEFVYKAFLQSGFSETHFSKSHAGGFEYIAVDDLYSHPAAKIICSFQYK